MHVRHLCFCTFFPLFTLVFSYDDYAQMKGCCTFKGPRFEDIECIITNRFNKKIMMEYNSTRGNWTGFTPYAIEVVKHYNTDPYDMLMRMIEMQLFCVDNKDLLRKVVNDPVIPTIKLKLVKRSVSGRPALLACTAYNSYPKDIRITWLRNGQEVTAGVSTSEAMSDGHWYYQAHSYLEYEPTPAETVACMVEHPGLSKPALRVWDTSLPVPEKVKIAVGLCSLLLGVVTTGAGLLYYKRRAAALFDLSRGSVLVPVEVLSGAGET